MKQTAIILLIFLFSLPSCNRNSNYKPEGLRKLNDKEIVDRARAGIFISEKTVFKDTLGNIISREDLNKIDREEFYGDQYVNADDELVEFVVRKATLRDKELTRKIEEGEPISIIDIDCSKVQVTLETIHESDQENRQGGHVEDPDIDRGKPTNSGEYH